MAAGDVWKRVDKYHVRLHRNGEPTGYTICAIYIGGQLTYELWHKPPEKYSKAECLARDKSAEPLKQLV